MSSKEESWFKMVQDKANKEISDKEMKNAYAKWPVHTPSTK